MKMPKYGLIAHLVSFLCVILVVLGYFLVFATSFGTDIGWAHLPWVAAWGVGKATLFVALFATLATWKDVSSRTLGEALALLWFLVYFAPILGMGEETIPVVLLPLTAMGALIGSLVSARALKKLRNTDTAHGPASTTPTA